jgi:type IV pilus assembly protein PilX
MKTSYERGFILISALIFMIVLTIIGLAVASNTTGDEKMARNFRDRDIAFAAAEAALRDAELRLTGSWKWPYQPVNINDFNSSCNNGLCDSVLSQVGGGPVDLVDFYVAGVGSSSPIGTTTGSPVVQGIPDQPRYRIEVVATKFGSLTQPTSIKAYRITAQARGKISTTRVTLQEIYLTPDSVN